jgi:hypothetical protein
MIGANSDRPIVAVCGSAYSYAMADREAAAAALDALDAGHALRRMISNHGAQNAEARACRAAGGR